jgi:hypothetical protein
MWPNIIISESWSRGDRCSLVLSACLYFSENLKVKKKKGSKAWWCWPGILACRRTERSRPV